MEATGIYTMASGGAYTGGNAAGVQKSKHLQEAIARELGSNIAMSMEEKKVEIVQEESEVTKVNMVILATSFGRTIARDIVATGGRTHLVQSVPGQPQHVTKPLIEIHMVPVINYWLQQLRKTPRLLPIEKKLWIVCNASNYDEFVEWAKNPKRCGLANGFPLDHIISNGTVSMDGAHMGHVRDLDLWAKKSGWKDEHVLVLEGDYMVNPDWSVNGVVEHSIIRGKDTVCHHGFMGMESTGPRHIVEAEAEPRVMPRITAIHPNPKPGVTASREMAGPLFFLRRTSIPLLQAWAANPANARIPAEAALGHFLSYLVQQVPVYSLKIPHVLDVLSLRNLMYVDGLFEYMARCKKELLQATRVSDTDSSLDFKTEFSGEQHKKIAVHEIRERNVEANVKVEEAELAARQIRGVGEVKLDMDKVVAAFNTRFENYMESQLQYDRDSRLPMRFADASIYNHRPRVQHPCYVTSNNGYGLKKPSQQQMPMSWNGTKGLFSRTFHPSPYHDTGFATATTSSKVHASFDEF